MGFIRGGLLVIISVLFFISLLAVNSLFTISSSLKYENIQNELVPVVKNALEEEIGLSKLIDEKLPEIQLYCENNSEFVFKEAEETISISCESVKNGTDAIIDESINNFVEKVYYEKYECDFIDCFDGENSQPFFLVSAKTRDYFNKKLYLVFLFSIILLIAMFFLVESKTNLPIIVGSIMIIASLPFLKLENFISFFADKNFLQFFSFLFTKAHFVFLVSLILGLIILITGIVLKLFVMGFKISSFFSKKEDVSKDDVKKIVKEEIFKNSSKNKKTK